MSLTIDERAREASAALRTAAELRPATAPTPRARGGLRIAITAVVIVVSVSVGAVLALRSESPRRGSVPADQPTGRFRASAVLLANAKGKNTTVTQDALLLTIGVVPRRAARALHFVGDPARLAAQIHTTVDPKTGSIKITTIQPTAARAVLVANTFAEQLVGYLRDVARGAFNLQVVAAQQRQRVLENVLRPVDEQIQKLRSQGQEPSVLLTAQQKALSGQLSIATRKYGTLVVSGKDPGRYRLVETTTGVRLDDPDKWPTRVRTTLIVLGLLAVLLLGFGLGYMVRRRWSAPVS